jgi:endonuclease/exonuclease/phosphatase (EEP) superfamily protein YafD
MRGFGFAIAIIAMLLTLGSIALDSVWFFDVLASLRVQAVIGSAVLALIALLFRKWYAGGLLACCMLVNAALVAMPMMVERPANAARSNDFSMLFYNSAQNTLELAPLLGFVKENKPDLLAFTEVYRWDIENLRKLFPDYRHTIGEPGVFGAVILSKLPISDFRVHRLAEGPSGRTLEVRLCAASPPNRCMALLVLHPTPPLSSDFHAWRNRHILGTAELAGTIAGEASIDGRVIMAGDFNVTPYNAVYRQALEQGGLSDAFVDRLPHSTWFSSSPVLGLAIDHVWTGRGIATTATDIGPLSGSDHLPILVETTLGMKLRP